MTTPKKVIVLGPGGGRAGHIATDQFLVKGTPRQRSGAFSVIEYTAAPGEPGPPLHLHRSWEEAWFVLEGRVTFTVKRRKIEATAGMYVLVPRGIPHAFQVSGRTPARWLGIFSPGKYVSLVEELGALIPKGRPPDMERVARLFEKYDSELVVD